MSFGLVQNKAGRFVSPNAESFQAAAEGFDWNSTRDFHLVMTDANGEQAYPISATTFILMYKKPKDAERSKSALKFFKWALEQGQKQADELDYAPLPLSLVRQIEVRICRLVLRHAAASTAKRFTTFNRGLPSRRGACGERLYLFGGCTDFAHNPKQRKSGLRVTAPDGCCLNSAPCVLISLLPLPNSRPPPFFGFMLPGVNVSPDYGLMCLKVLEHADVGQERSLGIEGGLSRSLEFRD